MKTELSTKRVMDNQSTNHALFISKCKAKTPIMLSSLSTVKSGMIFYNSNVGNRIHDFQSISFKFNVDDNYKHLYKDT